MTADHDDEAPSHAKMERNLERLPIFSLDPKNRKQEIRYEPDATRTWVVSTANPNGLPGPIANDLWLALGYHWNNFREPPADRTIRTSVAELASILGISRGGKQWAVIRSTLLELMEVRIMQQGLFRKRNGMVLRESHFRMIERVDFERDESASNSELRVEITFSQEIADSLNEGVFRLVDMNAYRSLKGDVAKRLYRYIDQKRYKGNLPPDLSVTVSLLELKDRFPLSPEAPSQIKRVLDRAHDEMKATGMLLDVEYANTGRGLAEWTVTYTFPGGLPALPPAKPAVSGVTTDLAALVNEMLDVLEGKSSVGWYTTIAKALPEERIRSILGEAKHEKRMGVKKPAQLRAEFGAECIRVADSYGINLRAAEVSPAP